ncbi:MAG: hypothetical protein R6W90_15550 [Ignavibacteriaceae bacterium]
MKHLFVLFAYLFVLFTGINLHAQHNSEEEINKAKALAMQAYMSYDKDVLLNARNIFEKLYNSDKTSLLPLYYMTLLDYKYLEMNLKGDGTLFDKYYDNAVSNAEILSNDKSFMADGKTLLAGIYMMKIAVSAMSAVTLSPKIHSLLDDVQAQKPSKPYSYIIRGMMKFNTPGIFGGSYDDALKNFNQAIKLSENQENDPLTPGWAYVEALAWKGRTLVELENYDAAVFTYKKALAEEPEYGWVKHVLLPQVDKEISNR